MKFLFHRPTFLVGTGAIIALVLTFGLTKGGSVSAGHDPYHDISCTSQTISGVTYPAGVFAGGAHMPAGSTATATLDGVSNTITFADQISKLEVAFVANPDLTKPHTYHLKLVSSDGQQGASFDLTGTIPACTTPSSTTTPATTVPSTSTTPSTSTVPSTSTTPATTVPSTSTTPSTAAPTTAVVTTTPASSTTEVPPSTFTPAVQTAPPTTRVFHCDSMIDDQPVCTTTPATQPSTKTLPPTR